jgi:hypothetical protein
VRCVRTAGWRRRDGIEVGGGVCVQQNAGVEVNACSRAAAC